MIDAKRAGMRCPRKNPLGTIRPPMQLYRATALIAIVLMVLLAVGYASGERGEPEPSLSAKETLKTGWMVVPANAGTQLRLVEIRLIKEVNPEWKDLSDQAF